MTITKFCHILCAGISMTCMGGQYYKILSLNGFERRKTKLMFNEELILGL